MGPDDELWIGSGGRRFVADVDAFAAGGDRREQDGREMAAGDLKRAAARAQPADAADERAIVGQIGIAAMADAVGDVIGARPKNEDGEEKKERNQSCDRAE